MPLPLVSRIPSTARALYTLDEDPPAPAEAKRQQRIGRWTLVEHLGAGASGSNVFAATCAGSTEVFAVKVLRGEGSKSACGLARFLREAALTCELAHTHLATGVESGVDASGANFLVMKLLRGKSLEELLQDCGRLHWRTATTLILHLARALAHLHTVGIVHRDVKPENLMITADNDRCTFSSYEGEELVHSSCNGAAALDLGRGGAGLRAVLIDLGLARRATSGADATDTFFGAAEPEPEPTPAMAMRRVATPAYSSIGSPGFMAPEQIRDAATAGHAADVYGLGTTWYAALTGVLPFPPGAPHKVMQQALEGDVLPLSAHLPGAPEAVEALIGWILQRDPKSRPPCGAALVAEVEAVLDAPHDAARVARARAAHDRRRRRQDALAMCMHALALCVGVLILGSLMWEMWEMRMEEEVAAAGNPSPPC